MPDQFKFENLARDILDRHHPEGGKETDVKQLAVLIEAFEIFRQRNAKRHDLWREFGWQDSVLQMRSKAMRLALLLRDDVDMDPTEVLDDALDLVNYAVFFIRNVRDPK